MLKSIQIHIFIIISLLLTSCDLFSDNDDVVSEITYSGTGVETVTSNKDGEVSITSSLDTDENQYDLTFEFTLLNEEDARPISGIEVHYTQLHDKVLIYLQDPNEDFTPSLFWGAPEELADYFGTISTQKGKPNPQEAAIVGTITLGIAAGIFLVGVASSYIGISKGIVKMHNHYTSGFVRQGEDYNLYCKTFDEVGEMIIDRIDTGMYIGNLILTVATYQGGHQVVSSLAMKAGTSAADHLIRDFYQEIISEGYATLDDIEGGKEVGVKLFFEDDPSLRNLFAKMEISPDHPECNNNGFRTSGSFALTNDIYSEDSNWDQIILNVMGSDYRVADWNDLVEYHNNGNDLLSMLDNLGITERGTIGYLTRNGNRQLSSTRYYFAARHEHQVPSGWAVHAHIDNNLLSLGSWWGERRILAIRK